MAARNVNKREREAIAEPMEREQAAEKQTGKQAGDRQIPTEEHRARVWEMHLRGMPKARIAAALALHRDTVRKIITACYAEAASERKFSPARKLDGAIQRMRRVQEQAWDDHDADDEREQSVLALSLAQAQQSSSASGDDGDPPRKGRESSISIRYQSQRSQYLRIILDAEKEIARLEGLYEGLLDVEGAGAVFRIQKLSESDVAALSARNSKRLPSPAEPESGDA